MSEPSKEQLIDSIAALPFLRSLGLVAVFYVPSDKLDDEKFRRDGQTPRQLIERFFLDRFGGLTHHESKAKGQWRAEGAMKVLTDRHDRYEVSFDGVKHTDDFLAFMSNICRLLEEESIYMTLGGRAWLVSP